MQSTRILTFITAMTVFAVLTTPVRSAAQDQQDHNQKYSVKNLGMLSGTFSAGNGINDRGWVAGAATLAGNTAEHATFWLDGLRFDLGTLGGPNSSVPFPHQG